MNNVIFSQNFGEQEIMLLIIPLIALFLSMSGIGTFFWYSMLPQDEKDKADRVTFDFFKKILEQRCGIKLDNSDNSKDLERKASEKGLTQSDLKPLVEEAANKARALISH